MLYTLNALNSLQESSDLVLTQQHYTIFDSRNFKSDKTIEDTFIDISNKFFYLWNTNIKPFLDAMIHDHDIYKVKPMQNIVLIPEEAMYLNIQGLEAKHIEYFFTTNGDDKLRLIGIDNSEEQTNSSFTIFDSPVYDPIHKKFYRPITIIFYKRIFREYKDKLNDILLRMCNYIILNFMDNKLATNNNIILNRLLVNINEDANKDAILLPESLNISDARFIFSYFYTLFNTLNGVLNNEILSSFLDYSSVIRLPDMFNFDMTDEEAAEAESKMANMTSDEANMYALGFKQKIYNRIWNLAKKYGNNLIPDSSYIEICSDIMRNITINLDKDYYEALEEHQEYEASQEESTDEYYVEEESNEEEEN